MTSSFFLMNFGEYLHGASQLSLEEFIKAHPGPTLLVQPFVPEEEASLATTTGEPGQGNVPVVLPIQGKQSGMHGYGGDRITLGRTGNNDLVIKSSDISKIHGFFSESETGMSYTDAHSSYGSRIDGREARPGVAVPLKSGASFELASIRARFFYPPELYAHLNSLSGQSSSGGGS
jgi:hypothetical protein